MSFKLAIRRIRTRWARTCARVLTRSSAPAPVSAPLPAVDEWTASLSSLVAETLDAADALALADSVPATSSDATPAPAVEPTSARAPAPATTITDATPAPAVTDTTPAPAVEPTSAPAPAPAPAVADTQNTNEVAAAQRVPDKVPTTANLRQWVQQYALARQLAAERSKSEELALRCIQLENELAIERTRTSILHTAAKTQPGGHDSAQTCADMAEAAPSVSRPSSTRSSTIVDDCDDIARLHEELDIATMATTAANQRAERAEKALAQMKACAIYAVNALETATARAQELADAHSASSALNIELEQALDQKAKSLVAVSSALATANQALSDTQNELAAERRATSERAKADTPRTVDAGQKTDGRIVDLRTKNTRLDLDLGIMTRKFKDEQELKMFIIRKVRGWVEKSECRCSNQVGRREFLTWLRRTDN